MAEQRTNIEFEDVLSSIRRLVSEEPPRPRRSDVLVLTPALRVVEGSAPPRPARTPADAAGGWPDTLPLRETLQAAPVRLADFAIPATPLPAQSAAPLPEVQSQPAKLAQAEPQMPAEEEIAAFFSSRGRSEMSLEERIAGLQAAIARGGAGFEIDETEEPEVTSAAQARPHHAEPPVAADPVPEQVRFTGFRQRRLVADAVEIPLEPRQTEDAPHPSRARPEPVFEEALIDEDSLREIVADLVRQELRGELGERITRNVRSLIRRELNRALALRDLSED